MLTHYLISCYMALSLERHDLCFMERGIQRIACDLDPYRGGSPNEPQGFHTDRASDRGRDHRHLGRDRDSEVREHEGKGISGFDEVGSAQPDYGRRGVF